MKLRKAIGYEDIVDIGLNLIKDETEILWECNDDTERAKCAFTVSGIVNLLSAIDKATQMTEEDKKTLEKNLVDNLKGDAVWHNYMTPCAIPSKEK